MGFVSNQMLLDMTIYRRITSIWCVVPLYIGMFFVIQICGTLIKKPQRVTGITQQLLVGGQ